MTKGPEKRRRETRGRIVQAARELFSKKGYFNTQVMDIVRAVNMSAGTFYNYFDDKRDLFEQISKENLEGLRTRLKKMRQPDDPEDIQDRLKRMHDTYNAFFDYVDENPQQLLMILRGGFGVDEDMDNDTWDYFSSFVYDLAEDFRKWEKVGVIHGVNPILLGHIIMGMTFHVAHSHIVERAFTREEAIDTLIALNRAMFSTYLTEKGKRLLEEKRKLLSSF